jgi:hypothetical protein
MIAAAGPRLYEPLGGKFFGSARPGRSSKQDGPTTGSALVKQHCNSRHGGCENSLGAGTKWPAQLSFRMNPLVKALQRFERFAGAQPAEGPAPWPQRLRADAPIVAGVANSQIRGDLSQSDPWLAAVETLQREQDLTRLAPKCGLIPTEAVERICRSLDRRTKARVRSSD